jgi:methylmalonyl-CoA epimerase
MNVEIDHIAIAVANLEEGLRFYRQLLGMTVSHQEAVEAERVNVAMLPLGVGTDSPTIELLEPLDRDSTVATFIEKRGPGLHHIALRVDDLAAAIEHLKVEGARLLNEPGSGAGGHVYVFVHPASTGGVLLELIQK